MTDVNALNRGPNAPKPRNNRSKVSNGTHLFPEAVDGRTAAGRRYRDLIFTFTNDLGGRDMLSENQQQLVRRNALISSLCEGIEAQAVQERPINVSDYIVLVNCQRRLCETLGLKRIAREVEVTPMDRLRQYQDAKKSMVISPGTHEDK